MVSRPALILDLDDTVVDSSQLAALRESRKWKVCCSRISETFLYEGVRETLDFLRKSRVKIGIVTSSVSFYAGRVLSHHGIKYDSLICYHDCNRRKPHPEPIFMCLSRMEATPKGSLGVGDSAIDAEAYIAAGISAWGAGWSSALSREGRWDKVIDRPNEIIKFFA